MAWATWRATLWLVLILTATRIIYLVWFCPYELVGDEAQYWDWSRRPAMSYYSKGPGVAWTIAASTGVLGHHEWSVRLPAVLFTGLATLLMARLAIGASRGDERVGFFAAVAFNLFPPYQFSALLMTIDAPHMACWMAACWAGAGVFRGIRGQRENREEKVESRAAGERSEDALTCPDKSGHPLPPPDSGEGLRGGGAIWWWLVLATALGVGFLFKYTILLLFAGLVIYAVVDRRRLRWSRKSVVPMLAALALFLVIISPVIIWNQQRGWPTVSHLLGRVGLPGGDDPSFAGAVGSADAGEKWSYTPAWTLRLLGDQLGILAPAAVLIALALWRPRRAAERGCPQPLLHRPRSERAPPDATPALPEGTAPGDEEKRLGTPGFRLALPSDDDRSNRLFLICCALPILAFYLAVSVVGKVQANWPAPGYATLFVLVAQQAVMMLGHKRGETGEQEPSAPDGGRGEKTPSPRPESGGPGGRGSDAVGWRRPLWLAMWRTWVVMALVVGIGALRVDLLARVPLPASLHGLTRLMEKQVAKVSGSRELAGAAQAAADTARAATGQEPFFIAHDYTTAGLLAFYLPGHPPVSNAATWLGGRRSAHDFFPDIELDVRKNPALAGHPGVLIGGDAAAWETHFHFARVTPATTDVPTRWPIFVGEDYGGPVQASLLRSRQSPTTMEPDN